MIKRIVFLFVILFVSVYFGVKMANDPGYLFLNYQQWTVEMPLWFAVIATLVTFALIYLVLRFFSFLGSLSGRWHKWRSNNKEKHAHTLTTRGLIAFTEGNWAQAEKHLTKAVGVGENPLINYLASARAAQEQGALNRRDKYLRKAQQSMPSAKMAVELSQAQLQIYSGQLEQALATLRHLQVLAPNHPYVLKLLQGVYVQIGDWEGLVPLLQQLKKRKVLSSPEYSQLEVVTYQGVLETTAKSHGLADLQKTWHDFPKAIKKQASHVAVYAKCLLALGGDDDAESWIHHTLKKQWDDELVRLYGLAKTEKPAKHLAKAEAWLKQHSHDPYLLLTLGRLSIQNQLWGKARTYLENSLAACPLLETYHTLAELLDQLGEHEAAANHYRLGLEKSLAPPAALPTISDDMA